MENYASNQEIHDRVLKFISPIYKSVVDNRSVFENWLEMFYNMWRCYIDIQYYKGNSNAYIPVIRKNTEEGVNNISTKLFPTEDSFGVMPLPGTPDKFSDAVNTLLRYQLYDQVKVKVKIKPTIRDFIRFGSTFLKTYFDPIRRCPNFKTLEWRKTFYPYPETSENIDDCLATFELMDVDKFELQRLSGDGTGKKYDTSKVNELLSKGVANSIPDYNQPSVPGITQERYKDLPIYDLVECYTTFDIKGKDEDIVITWSPSQNIIIQISPNELRDAFGKSYKPYLAAQFIKEPNKIYGHSIYEAGQRLQYLLNDSASLVFDDGFFMLNPIVKGDFSSINNPQGLVIKPGAKWDMPDPNQIQFDRPTDVLSSGLNFINQIKFMLQEMTNIGGMTPMTSKRVTATEIATYSQLLGVFIGSTVSDLEEILMKPFLQRMYDLDKQYLTEKELRQIIGAKSFDVQTIGKKKVFTYGYDFKWLGSTQSMNIHIKSAQMIQFLDIVSRIPISPEDTYQIDKGYILKAIWRYGFDLPDVDKVVKDKFNVSISPEAENQLMSEGKTVEVNFADKDMEHLLSHDKESQKYKQDDPIFRVYVEHSQKHLHQLKDKVAQQNAVIAQNQQRPPIIGGSVAGIPQTAGQVAASALGGSGMQGTRL